GDSYVGDPTDPLGHDWDEGVMKAPASTVYEGKMLYTCLRCGETREEIIPKRDEVPKNERLRILFIGNSYSEDLTDGFTYPDGTSYTGYSTLYEMLRTVTGGEIEIEIGLLMSGGKSLTWHASVANNGYDYYAFRVVGDSTGGRWVELSQNATTVDGLNFYNWDMVVLQPYGNEVKKGETTSPNAQMKPFAKLEDSVPFMLDFVEIRNPGAEIWLYLPIANIRKAEMNGGESDFGKTVYWVETASFMSGRETHKQFSGVIPIGTAIQNARSTYMAVQQYVYPGAPDPTVVNFDSDPIMGLQRDDLHVSYSVGRYIDALTFCKTAVPLNMKKPGAEPETVAIRRPDGAPALPEEYKELARAASDAAAESVDNKFVPIRMTGFEIDPTDTLMEKLTAADLEAFCPDPSAAGTEDAVYNAIAASLPDNAVLTVDGLTVDGATATATVTVLYGYTARTAELTVTLLDHGHEYELASSDFAHDGREEYTEVYVCRICGKEDVRVIGKTPCPGLVFTDMPKVGNWAHDGIDFCLENGLMNGMTQNTFVPAGDMTRAMLVTVLWRAEGEPAAPGTTPFTDVKAKWAKDAVAWAYENEIVKGMTATTFAPDDKLSREQIATILYRFTEYKGGDVSSRAELDRFPDGAKTHSYAKDAVSWAVAEGLISGTKAGDRVLLDPRGSATRAQVATILMRYLENRDHTNQSPISSYSVERLDYSIKRDEKEFVMFFDKIVFYGEPEVTDEINSRIQKKVQEYVEYVQNEIPNIDDYLQVPYYI
ncbi:MAG: S-layer homology domain-containing protein, partial [Clostridia bacterium]|nr:S-layer homology domain-containing protein [Clostridia bacterium]